jgi:uncharacterized membrane protein
MGVAVLALIGFFISLYLLAYHLGWLGAIVCGLGSCATVQASPYATLGPVPVPALGVAGYLALVVLGLLGVQPAFRGSRAVAILLLGGATAGFAFSAYLTYLEAVVIQAWCMWCVISAIVMTLIFLASLPEALRLRGEA